MVGLRTPTVQQIPADPVPTPQPAEEAQEPFGDLANLFDDGEETSSATPEKNPDASGTTAETADDDFDIEFEDFEDFEDFDEEDESNPQSQIDIPPKQQNPGRSRWINT